MANTILDIDASMMNQTYYPHHVTVPIKRIETHISIIYLTGDYAYKIKKPVKFGQILDFQTLKKRQFYCHQEIKLNKRLAEEMYLGLVSLSPDSMTSDLDTSEEFAIKMIQYPEELIMKNLLDGGKKVEDFTLSEIARILNNFHQESLTTPDAGKIKRIKKKIDENFSTTSEYTSINHSYKKLVNDFLINNQQLFEIRPKIGKIRDNHGDVQPNNIFILPQGPIIFDCVEFNPNLRHGDVIEEIAFLAMELDKYDLYTKSDFFIDKYTEFSKDEMIEQLLDFYKSYRAYVRAKVAVFRAHQTSGADKNQLLEKGEEYFKLAHSYFGL